MTRIIAGKVGGRRITTPTGEQTRPTSDRVREALLAAIESWCGSLHGLRFLDLYAGSGAVGLEAWSRGAEAVTFVESDRAVAALIADNARSLGFHDAEVHQMRTQPALVRRPKARYDVVYSDPPYPLSEQDLRDDLLLLQEWVAPDALVVVERSRRSPEPTWPAGIVGDRSKRYGDTVLWYGHALPEPGPGAEDDPETSGA